MSRVLVMLIALLGLTACAAPPDTLRVERVLTNDASGRFEPFDRTVSDAAAVADLSAVVRSLPEFPYREGSEPFCPIAFGLRYRLTFAHAGTPALVALVEADGCRFLYLGPADRRATTESFWARLAGALGFYTRGNDLFPLPLEMRR